MRAVSHVGILALAALCLEGCAATTGSNVNKAPAPAKSIDVARFYVGRWYEIARTPMRITRNCVAGTTDYSRTAEGGIFDTDACRMNTPSGRVKTFLGPVRLLNPGQNSKMRVSYRVWRVFRVPWVYWIVDHDDDYRWFILSDPSFRHVSIFTRQPNPPADEVARLKSEIRALGYDPDELETPQHCPDPPSQVCQ